MLTHVCVKFVRTTHCLDNQIEKQEHVGLSVVVCCASTSCGALRCVCVPAGLVGLLASQLAAVANHMANLQQAQQAGATTWVAARRNV